MELNEANYWEIEAKLKDWLQKKKANPSYNRAYQAMSEEKLLAYINVAINLGVGAYESILRVLQQEAIDRLNHRAKQGPINANRLNDAVKVIDEKINNNKLLETVRKSAKNFETSTEGTNLKSTYQSKINKLVSECSHLTINYSEGINKLLDYYSVSNLNSSISVFLTNIHKSTVNRDNAYKDAGLFDLKKNAPDFTNIDRFWLEFYTAIYKEVYFGAVVLFKFLEMAASKTLIDGNIINLMFNPHLYISLKSKSSKQFGFFVNAKTDPSRDLKGFLNGASNALVVSYFYSGKSWTRIDFDLNDLAGSFKKLISEIAPEL